jgi:hypothetical protein
MIIEAADLYFTKQQQTLILAYKQRYGAVHKRRYLQKVPVGRGNPKNNFVPNP